MAELSLYVPILAPAAIFLAVACLIYALTIPGSSGIEARLNLGRSVGVPTGGGERSTPFSGVFSSLLGRFSRAARAVSSQRKVDEAQQRLSQAGNPINVNHFLGIRLITALLPLAIAILTAVATHPTNTKLVVIFGVVALVGWRLPEVWLGRAVKARRKRIQRSLPDAFDLIIVCVEAGHSLEAALTIVSRKLGGVLGEEIERMLREITMGKLRREALKDMAERLQVQELQTFVAAINQAEQLGVGIAQVLRAHGDAMRVKRRQMAEEEAAKLPVKMLVPLALFIFPSIMIVIVGPVVITALAVLGHHPG